MDYPKIKDWEAKRAGGRITVNGTDVATGKPIKVTKVDTIKPSGGRVIAVTHDGDTFVLVA